MPRVSTFVSSQSGEAIPEGSEWSLRLSNGAEYLTADLTEAEARSIVDTTHAEQKAKRGRRRKTVAAA